MPKPVREKYDSLAPANQNNSRAIFRSDWERIGTSEAKARRFAEKYGLSYDSKHAGEADHSIAHMPDYSDEWMTMATLAEAEHIY